MATVGQITIDVEAGTAKALLDLDKVNAAVKQVGAGGLSSTRVAALGFTELTKGIEGSSRGAASFLVNVLKLGPVISAAFPLLGGLAFAGMLGKLGTEIYNFFDKIKQAPERIGGAFHELNAQMQTSVDEAKLHGAQLDKELAILEGKPVNNLKIAFEEASVAADKMGERLEKSLKTAFDNIAKEAPGFWETIGAGMGAIAGDILAHPGGSPNPVPGVSDAADAFKAYQEMKHLKELVGGLSGYGGQNAKVMRENARYAEEHAIEEKSGVSDKTKLKTEEGMLADHYRNLVDIRQDYLKKLQQYPTDSSAGGETKGGLIDLQRKDLALQQEEYKNYIKEHKIDDLKNLAEANKTTPMEELIKRLEIGLAGLSQKHADLKDEKPFDALDEAAQAYREDIQRINEEQKKEHKPLYEKLPEVAKGMSTSTEERRVYEDLVTTAQLEAWTKVDKSVNDITTSITTQIDKLREETKAIDHNTDSYEEQKKAAGKAAVDKLLEEQKKNILPAPTSEQQDNVRNAGEQLYYEERKRMVTELLDQISVQIKRQDDLSTAEVKGAAAVQQLNTEYKVKELVLKDGLSSEQQTQLLSSLKAEAESKERAEVTKTIAEIKRKAEALYTLSLAVGTYEKLMAQMNNNVAGNAFKIADPNLAKLLSDEQNIDLMKRHQNEIQSEANDMLSEYSDKMVKILELENAVDKSHASQVEKMIAKRKLQREEIDLEIQYDEALGTVKGSLDALFASMNKEAMNTGKVLADSLKQAMDQTADELGKILSGQVKKQDIGKDFGKMFQHEGGSMISAAIKQGIAHLFPKQQHVIVDNIKDMTGGKTIPSSNSDITFPSAAGGNGNTADLSPYFNMFGMGANAGSVADLSPLFRLFGQAGGAAAAGGAAGGLSSLSSMMSYLPFLAEGGDADPGQSYWVGEKEPEIFTPETRGTVTPLSKMGSGGDTHYHYDIDARGSQFGTENRIARSIEMSHHMAVTNSLRAAADRKERTPQRR